jgi:P-type Cu+ transporter
MVSAAAPIREDAVIRLDIAGMHCASCVSRIERGLNKLPGVTSSSVNLATNIATVSFDPLQESQESLIAAVTKSGYTATTAIEVGDQQPHISHQNTVPVAAIALSIPIAAVSMSSLIDHAIVAWIVAALTTFVVFVCGRQFFIGAWNALLHGGTATMDTLVVTGATAAYVLSFYELISVHQPQLYFETASTIVALILLGRHFEGKARQTASNSIGALTTLAPATATLVLSTGVETDVPIRQVLPGDILKVRPGEKIAVDGTVIDGSSAVDESLLTGESVPSEKSAGSAVIAGTINTDGSLTYRATAVGSATVLASIVRLIQEAQGSKAPIQRLADQISSVFVPAVFVVAVLTVLVRHFAFDESFATSMIPAVAVLVIACPCALGLATPTAIMVSSGRGAGLGILIRNGEVLERAQNIRTVLFDKTGTLTHGKPAVIDIVVTGTWSRDKVLQFAASAESGSEHPVAKSIVQCANSEELPKIAATSFISYAGRGVQAVVDGTTIMIGNPDLAQSASAPLTDEIAAIVRRLQDESKTVLVMTVNEQVVAVFGLTDSVRSDAILAIQAFKATGMDVAMLSGDQPGAVAACAEKLGINKYYGSLLPADKAATVKNWPRTLGQAVAMVGDGVNDGPALASADVGIAMGHAADVAMESADITLMRADLGGVQKAIDLSKQTMRIIKQNLFWAFIFNVVGIPLAALGLLNPMVAAFAMACSSITVVSNSLRLRTISLGS